MSDGRRYQAVAEHAPVTRWATCNRSSGCFANPHYDDCLSLLPRSPGPACFCGQPDDRTRVHRSNACEWWVQRA